eukprot:SAG22_NODE_1293_length_4847_cov_1.996841_2_plen_68_part_00
MLLTVQGSLADGTLSNQISEPPGDPVVYFPIYKVAKPDPADNLTLYYWYWNVSRHMILIWIASFREC